MSKKAPIVSKEAKTVSKKAPIVSANAKIVNCKHKSSTVSRKLPTVSKKAASYVLALISNKSHKLPAKLPPRFPCTKNQRKTKGGGKLRGGETYNKTPPQKRFWTPPPHMIRFPPPFVHAMSFSLEGTGTDQTNPTFGALQDRFLEGTLYGTFSPPQNHDTFCPPISRFPKKARR